MLLFETATTTNRGDKTKFPPSRANLFNCRFTRATQRRLRRCNTPTRVAYVHTVDCNWESQKEIAKGKMINERRDRIRGEINRGKTLIRVHRSLDYVYDTICTNIYNWYIRVMYANLHNLSRCRIVSIFSDLYERTIPSRWNHSRGSTIEDSHISFHYEAGKSCFIITFAQQSSLLKKTKRLIETLSFYKSAFQIESLLPLYIDKTNSTQFLIIKKNETRFIYCWF